MIRQELSQPKANQSRLKDDVLLSKRKRYYNSTLELTLLTLPAVLFFFVFNYLPMIGLILAFKDYRYNLGVFGSRWVGFENFIFFFTSQHAWRVMRNTISYSALFMVLGIVTSVGVALLLFEIRKRIWIKIYQTCMILPNFLSWVIVGFITYLFFNMSIGILNQIVRSLGFSNINWYAEPRYWPYILCFVNIWKNVGMGTIIYYAGLMSIDKELFEAAQIDGANKMNQIWHISIPALIPLITILTILSMGNFFRGDFGLFFNIPRNVGLLYSATDIIDTYIYRGLMQVGDIGMTTAIGFFQSIIGLLLVIVSNCIVRKIEPDNSLF